MTDATVRRSLDRIARFFGRVQWAAIAVALVWLLWQLSPVLIPFAVAALRTVHVDLVFVGVHGMDPRSGFTCPNLLEADTDRALIEAGRRLVVVTDHSKWGVIGISSIARLDQADVLITDVGLSPEARRILVESVRELVVVDPGVPVADPG